MWYCLAEVLGMLSLHEVYHIYFNTVRNEKWMSNSFAADPLWVRIDDAAHHLHEYKDWKAHNLQS